MAAQGILTTTITADTTAAPTHHRTAVILTADMAADMAAASTAGAVEMAVAAAGTGEDATKSFHQAFELQANGRV
jgi:hypothetical protein